MVTLPWPAATELNRKVPRSQLSCSLFLMPLPSADVPTCRLDAHQHHPSTLQIIHEKVLSPTGAAPAAVEGGVRAALC